MTKTAMITGASRGIGSCLADLIAQKGYDLILIAKQPEGLERKKQQLSNQYPDINIKTYSLDFNDAKKVEHFCHQTLVDLPVPTIYIGNAGILKPKTIEIPPEDTTELYQVNVMSTMTLTNAVARQMKTQQTGYIFLLASNAAYIHLKSVGTYSSTKAAILHYAETLADTLQHEGIKVTALCPAVTNTDMVASALSTPTDQVIQPSDLAKTVDWLLSLSAGASVSSVRIRCVPVDINRSLNKP